MQFDTQPRRNMITRWSNEAREIPPRRQARSGNGDKPPAVSEGTAFSEWWWRAPPPDAARSFWVAEFGGRQKWTR